MVGVVVRREKREKEKKKEKNDNTAQPFKFLPIFTMVDCLNLKLIDLGLKEREVVRNINELVYFTFILFIKISFWGPLFG